jgi:hypothetical protein
MMRRSIVEYWQLQSRCAPGWCHPDDAILLTNARHCFNLEYPVSPFIGDVLNARVVILGANAGYDPATTPGEFEGEGRIDAYLSRVAAPDSADWSYLHNYYNSVNYGEFLTSGDAALVNCCAYRSPSISKEKDNQELIGQLPSCALARRWLEDAIVPLARGGALLVVAKRYGLWRIGHLRRIPGVIFDPAPVSPHMAHEVLIQVRRFLD